jgi:hypothetical protein
MADSIRDALTQAFDKQDEPPVSPSSSSDSTPPAGATPPDTGSTPPDASGGAVSGTPEDKGAAPVAAPTGQTPALGSPPQSTPAPAAGSDPAPASWKAEAKTDWDKVPASARAEIKRREADMQRAFSSTAQARKFEEGFHSVIKGYEPLLQKHNVTDPLREVVEPMLQFRAVLEDGTPHQKALAVRNMVKGFNIDIDLLDQMLVDETGKFEQPAPPKFDPRAVPELAPLFEMAQRVEQAKAAQLETLVSEYDALPHADALREDVADIMDLWARRGQAISIQDAHKRALALHPELAPPVPPPAPPTVSEAAAILAKSRNAASTVAGAPRAGTQAKPSDLRSTLEAAFAEHST